MKKLFFFLLISAVSSASFAQYQVDTAKAEITKQKKFDPNRLVFGGNLGANFGDFTFINVSPQVGYSFNQYLTAGGGINFIYNSQKFRNAGGDELYRYNYAYAGLNVFARAFPIRFIMLSAQPELNYNWGKIKYDNEFSNLPDEKIEGKFVPSVLVGGGVIVPTGRRGGIMISLQYNVVQDERSPYGRNAFVNVGFTF